MKGPYNFQERESYWTEKWVADKLYATPDNTEHPEDNEYVLDMFPYPSGSGLHVGHPMGYVGTDILSRMRRMQGKNVLHPMGYDAFGLPAEQYAIDTNNHPSSTINAAIESFRGVMQRLGLSYDWDRELSTADPEYYKWTQVIFTKLQERGLASYEETEVNWCAGCGTVLANEEVRDGLCDRGSHPVERKRMKQWVLKMTEYAERLLKDLDLVDWPEHIKEEQRNWIGRSEGLEITFTVEGRPLEVYTTRPETLYGVTCLVLAPEHPLVDSIVRDDRKAEVAEYVKNARNVSERDRQRKQKTGVFTGTYASHPITGEAVQVWIGDYVLARHGKGAVMGVPSADDRDREFAEEYGIPLKEIFPTRDASQPTGDVEKILANSGILDGLTESEARRKIMDFAEAQGFGKREVHYRMTDWVFSRQRYWGEPFPLIHRPDGTIALLDLKELPLTLPEMSDFRPLPSKDPTAVLERATDWVNTPDGKRETNTMPGWAGSCWYYLRFIDPKNGDALADYDKLKAWLPVDLYVGGSEHNTRHVLYARFWHKVLYDAGLVPTSEPFRQLVNQGLICGEDGEKMSKSKGNAVAVKDVIDQHGADALRVYEMFLGPFDRAKRWDTDGIKGVKRWLENIVSIFERVSNDAEMDLAQKQELNSAIKKVTDDTATMKFNTAIASLMDLVNNKLRPLQKISPELARILCKLIAPYAPMLAEEMWCNVLEQDYSVHRSSWPEYDQTLAEIQLVTMVIQVNGKVRATVRLDRQESGDESAVAIRAQTIDKVQRALAGKAVTSKHFVPGKVINFVASDTGNRPPRESPTT
ncbi:MAG: leucine--tRNA ligase [Planctomycetota bacterium]